MPEFEIYKGKKDKTLKKMFKKDNIFLIYIVLLAIFLGIIIASFITFYFHVQKSEYIQSGIYIKGINISGLTKEEAIKLVDTELKKEMNDQIILKYKDNEYYVEVEQIEAKFNVEASVNYAYDIARTGNFIQDVKEYTNVLITGFNIEPILVYNDEALTNYLYNIEANLPDQLEQSSYYVEDDKLIITNGKFGAGIYIDELKNTILDAIQKISYNDKYIEIPVYIKYPDGIDLAKIHEDIYRKMENAYFTKDPYVVYSEITGIDFDIDKLRNQILENTSAEEYKIDLIYTEPEVTVKDLGKEAFPNLLATFSTKYPASNVDRTTNLRLASNKINGTVVMPGETFSYNKVVGKRTIAAGYKEAAIYQDGQVTSGLGGGICQISSTLYNAAVFADLEITSRRNHMFVPSYVSGGRDATVVWGSTDFKFINSRNYPIKIESSVSGGVATVNIYGLKNEIEYDISIETKTIKKTSSDFVVDAFKIYKLNGNIVKSEKLSRDTYKSHS